MEEHIFENRLIIKCVLNFYPKKQKKNVKIHKRTKNIDA